MDFDHHSMQSGACGRFFEMPGSDIRITGYLKKMKTMKKKFFVLRSTSSSGPARLEYYDSEKKFNAGQQPKRMIKLHMCFNINRRSDSRHKHCISLYTKEECFSVVCEDEKEQERWLSLMLEHQNEYVEPGGRNECREHYDYVWQVTVQPKGLGLSKNIRGPYRLCMTKNSIYLFKLNSDTPHYVFQLETVRSVGHQDNLFKIVLGKIAPTGEGELQMHSDDAAITQNIHETILDSMKNMDRRPEAHDTRRTVSESLHGSASSLSRPPPEFRHRAETFTQGSNRVRPKVERPMSVYTRTARSTSHLHNAVSPGSSPHIHGFVDNPPIMGSHRYRSDSESKASRSSMLAVSDEIMHDMHNLSLMRPALQEEPDFDSSLALDRLGGLPSPAPPHTLDLDEPDSQGGEEYMEMNPGSATPPTPANPNTYINMGPTHKADSKEAWGDQGSSYMPMTATRSSSAPIPIHPPHSHAHAHAHSHSIHSGGHPDHGLGYLDMTAHSPLPPVKEGGSNEGYLPMSPSYNSCDSDTSQLKPDRVVCMLSDDGSDFSQPPLRTYSLGSRPVKPSVAMHSTGYMDMSGRKGVSDNGRSCSAPHLVNPHRSARNNNMDSPTPSASPLSMSLKSDDSDSFMELDFYRPRTASDSYSYRPRASSFGMPQSSVGGQGHRPRSASHGQGQRPMRRQKMLAECMGRLNHDSVLRSHNTSHGSFDSLKVSSSESLKKLSQEVRTKTSQLNSSGYMDMSGVDKRFTPSPQPASVLGNRPEHEGYVDMTLGGNKQHEGYVDMTLGVRKSSPELSHVSSKTAIGKTNSSEKLQEFNKPSTDSVYINYESQEGAGKKESSSCLSPSDNADAYIMYEPAATPTNADGKENVPKNEASVSDPRNRSGSAGKEGKKRGFFSLRHGHGDSGKHSSKKGDPSQQSGGATVYSTTGGEKFGSLGRDIRQKSKDLSKATGRKSSSFSKTFGISTTKPGKLLRKSPTPPRSLDGNDEYIEFIPTAAKSDSDSSHSSGSIKMSRSRSDATPAKEDPVYVGYEPGNIPTSSSAASSQRSIPVTSSYLPMNVGGAVVSNQTTVFKVIKPVKKSGARRSKSGEESGQMSALHPPTSMSVSQNTETCQSQNISPRVHHGSEAHPNPSVSVTQPSDMKTSLVKPVPVYPTPSQSGSVSDDSSGKSGSSLPAFSLSSCVPINDPLGLFSARPTSSTTVSSSLDVSRGVSQTAPSQSSSSPRSVTQSHASPSCTVMSHASSSSLSSSTCPLPSSAALSSTVTSSMPASVLSPLPVPDAGYMDFDPRKSAITGAESPMSGIELVVARSYVPAAASEPTTGTAKKEKSSSPKPAPALTSSPGLVHKSVGSSEAQQPASCQDSAGKKPSNRNTSETESTRMSTDSASTSSSGAEVSKTLTESTSSQCLDASDSKTTSCQPKTLSSSQVSPGNQPQASSIPPGGHSPGNNQPGLARMDSLPAVTPADEPVSSGCGRGRHNSSSSVGAMQSKKGRSSSINTAVLASGITAGSNTRHSVSDLSGYEEMTFPSNALSQQQSLTTQGSNTQETHSPHPSSSQGSGSVSGSQGILNYATLDLGSADSLGDSGDTVKTPRNRSRHSSAADEKITPLPYATIDFDKSESLRSSTGKDMKVVL